MEDFQGERGLLKSMTRTKTTITGNYSLRSKNLGGNNTKEVIYL